MSDEHIKDKKKEKQIKDFIAEIAEDRKALNSKIKKLAQMESLIRGKNKAWLSVAIEADVKLALIMVKDYYEECYIKKNKGSFTYSLLLRLLMKQNTKVASVLKKLNLEL